MMFEMVFALVAAPRMEPSMLPFWPPMQLQSANTALAANSEIFFIVIVNSMIYFANLRDYF